jgi:diguanylate cyclase (GGDEF)-like protein
MSGESTESADPGELLAEVGQLRAQLAVLEEQVATLDSLAHQDPLVAMPNRRGFLRELERLIAHSERYGSDAALLFVDLDGLKAINDSFGHRTGDEALIKVASLLAEGIRRSDLVARIGGDEFGILLENAGEEKAHETAARLGDAICNCEFRHDRQEVPLSVTIGIAMIAKNDTVEDVMHRADAEMYRGKAAAAA